MLIQWLKNLFKKEKDVKVVPTKHAVKRYRKRFLEDSNEPIVNIRNYLKVYIEHLYSNDLLLSDSNDDNKFYYKQEVWILEIHERKDYTKIQIITCYKLGYKKDE